MVGTSDFCARVLFAACLFVFVDAACAAPATNGKLDVVAIASDVQSVVVRNSAGRLQRYTAGDAIADSNWRLARVIDNTAVLESSHRFAGKPYDMRLISGQSVDLGAIETTLDALGAPHAQPAATMVRPLSK